MRFYDSPLAARIFDLQHEGDALLEAECDLMLEESGGADGPVLDMGCGTGRILLPALARGIDVWGCDSSLAFLSRLAMKGEAEGLAPRPRIWCCDLAEPGVRAVPDGGFALAFAAFRTFDHLVEPGAQLRFLWAVRELLRPGGRLILDLINPHPLSLDRASIGQRFLVRDDIDDEETGCTVVWWSSTQVDLDQQMIHEITQYDLVGADGRIESSYYLPFSLRWTPEDEMRAMAEEAGLEVETCWGGFEREPFETGSGDAVWVLRKPDA